MKYVSWLIFLFVLPLSFAWGQHISYIEDILLNASRNQDSLQITITTTAPKMQLSFLMQGIRIIIQDSLNLPAIIIELPNARMVRDKIRHHPNEVKAMHKQNGDEVRPDLLPLVSALNDTCCKAKSCDDQAIGCTHTITLDKKEGGMAFSISILPPSRILHQDSVLVEIFSFPMEMKSEFEGQRLSSENLMPTDGMGQAPTNRQDSNRLIHWTKRVCIEDDRAKRIHGRCFSKTAVRD